jgi:hypothetical protein
MLQFSHPYPGKSLIFINFLIGDSSVNLEDACVSLSFKIKVEFLQSQRGFKVGGKAKGMFISGF